LAEPGEERRCESCGELNPARAKFCLECGTQIKLDIVDQLPQGNGTAGERRVVSVVFADLSGFTAYSEGSDVEDVRSIAQEAAGRLGEIVVRYGGVVDNIIGDCVMGVFGAPVAHEDDAERAVRAALDMQTCVQENHERFAGLTLCVGVNSGEAMYAPVGADGRYTVLGDTVNTAARLQGAAARGAVVIGQPTYHAVADVIDCEPLEPIKAKNKAEPVPAWRAVAVKGERPRHKPVRASLAGREEELNRLRELWELVRTERRPYGAVLLGAPGIGKSRLIGALTDEVGSSALVLRGRCLPYGEGITYWPVIEIIQQVAGIHHDDDPDTVSRKLGGLLESLGMDDLDELRTIAVALANLIGAPTTPRGTYTATEISSGELHWGIRRILELGARNLPLVLVLEDMHWAEPTLLELIDYIFRSTAEAPILGIASARPELKDTGSEILAPRPNRRILELEALGEEAARQILAELLGADDVLEGPFSDLMRSAGGNPLFLEELVQMWMEARAGSDDPLAALEGLAVPNNLQALIDSRLDRLPAGERHLLSRAAVIGDVFWSGALSVLTRGNGGADALLEALEARDLIRTQPASMISGEREYAFKHGLIRDVAYGRLAKAERATLHEGCGRWIDELQGELHEFTEIIAYHLEQACRLASDITLGDTQAPTLAAVQALQRAADKAEAREGMRESARFLGRAIDLLGDGFPETGAELTLRRARLITGLGEYDSAYADMQRAAETAGDVERTDLRCRALISLAEIDALMGRASQARALLDEAEQLARRIDDPPLRIRAAWARATLLQQFEASPGPAVEQLIGAVALAEEVGNAELMLTGHMRLGALYFNIGRLRAAEAAFERSIELAKEQGSLRHQAWLTACLGLIRAHRGPRAEAHDLYASALDWMERTNDLYMRIQTLMWQAALELKRDDTKAAVKLLRQAMAPARQMGGQLIAQVGSHLVEALTRQGRVAEAREIAVEVRALAPQEYPLAQAGVLVSEAFAALAASDETSARASFDEALPIFERQGEPIELGDAYLAYARLLVGLGDDDAAIKKFEYAREIFERIGALATVAEIDGEVVRLRSLERPERKEASA